MIYTQTPAGCTVNVCVLYTVAAASSVPGTFHSDRPRGFCKMSVNIDLESAPAAFKSQAWKHFGFPVTTNSNGVRKVDKETTVCKYCFNKICYSNGTTTNMTTHLRRHHPAVLENDSSSSTTATTDRSGGPSGQLRLKECFARKLSKDSPRSQMISEAIGLFIACDLRPFSIVEAPSFKRLLNTLEPRYTIPSRTHFR